MLQCAIPKSETNKPSHVKIHHLSIPSFQEIHYIHYFALEKAFSFYLHGV